MRASTVLARLARLARGGRTDCGGPSPDRYRDVAYPLDETSPDQLAIEAVLAGLAAPGRRWLHVGVGGSGLARRFAGRGVAIDGITVDPREVAYAATLDLPGYRVTLCDKCGPGAAALPGAYDVVIDNNPTSYACCRRHFRAWLGTVAALLVPGGAMLTDVRGLGYAEPYGFRTRIPALAREGARAGLSLEPRSPTVYALVRPLPLPPRR